MPSSVRNIADYIESQRDKYSVIEPDGTLRRPPLTLGMVKEIMEASEMLPVTTAVDQLFFKEIIGFGWKLCDRCGGLYDPKALPLHPIIECDDLMVKIIMES